MSIIQSPFSIEAMQIVFPILTEEEIQRNVRVAYVRRQAYMPLPPQIDQISSCHVDRDIITNAAARRLVKKELTSFKHCKVAGLLCSCRKVRIKK